MGTVVSYTLGAKKARRALRIEQLTQYCEQLMEIHDLYTTEKITPGKLEAYLESSARTFFERMRKIDEGVDYRVEDTDFKL